eukprot:s2379_g4.t2
MARCRGLSFDCFQLNYISERPTRAVDPAFPNEGYGAFFVAPNASLSALARPQPVALERMLKRSPQDEVGGEEKRPRREDHVELCTPTFKLLAPKTLASAIQFSHLVIENAAQGKLHLTEPEDMYPGTEQQVVTIESPAWENIASAMKHILAMANNCTECVMPGHEDERRLAIVMPSRSISALIGVKGANVKELQLRTGCHIHVDDVAIGHGPGGDRAVNINGLPAGLEQAIVRTVEVVQESHDQVWFRKWAERSNAERLEQEQAPPLRGQVLRQNSEQEVGQVGQVGNGCMGSMMGNMAGMMMGNMPPTQNAQRDKARRETDSGTLQDIGETWATKRRVMSFQAALYEFLLF